MCKWHPTYGMIFATLLATVNWSQYAKADPRVFTAKDFNFYDSSLRKWAPIIIEGVNKVAHENKECSKADPFAVDFAGEDQVHTKNPTFYVGCTNAVGTPFNVRFSADDVRNDFALTSNAPISATAAAESCDTAVKARAEHPSTVDMSRVWNASFRTFPNGRTVFETTFSARNSFNLKLRFNVSCYFEGARMTDVEIFEDASK